MKFLIESTSLTPLYQDSTQSRVRRIIGRRRAAGLDRYIGVLRQGGGQDSIDPITELLSQLSSKVMSSSNGPVYVCVCADSNGGSGTGGGGGGGAEGRRPLSDFPTHIQQLLDQQERQAFERGSPLRRPVYRKVLAGSAVPYDGPLPTYLVPGTCGTRG